MKRGRFWVAEKECDLVELQGFVGEKTATKLAPGLNQQIAKATAFLDDPTLQRPFAHAHPVGDLDLSCQRSTPWRDILRDDFVVTAQSP
jgi:hypothetical protein